MSKDEEKREELLQEEQSKLFNFNYVTLENIKQKRDMLDASKQGGKYHSEILRWVIADIRNEQIALDKELTDEDVLKVLRKQRKRLRTQ